MDIGQIYDDRVNKIIKDKQLKTDVTLQDIRDNFRNTMLAHVQYHKYLMKEAAKSGDKNMEIRNKLLADVFQSILDHS